MVSSIKSVLGHTLGASGALSLAAVLLAMKHGWIPPTANHEEFDPECDIDCVPNTPRRAEVSRALVHSFAFGGANVVIAVEKP
jgi:nodulation protein E